MALNMTNIYKSYDGTEVLKGVNFSVKEGEVHALLGMNGAGKSTLMKILSGYEQLDHGSIEIDEKEVTFKNPKDAQNHGIGIVVQEVDTALFPQLSVYENLINGTKLPPIISWKKVRRKAEEALDRVQLNIPVDKLIQQCSLREKQMILLAKVLFDQAKYIILDEPTAPLSDTETNILFDIIRQLKKQGISIIYISHRLSEVKEICDQVTILRDGKIVHKGSTSNISIEEMIQHMVGENIYFEKKAQSYVKEDLQLSIRELYIPEKNSTIDLDIYKGEIVGIGGLAGSGKSELAQAVFGLNGGKGKWEINGKECRIKSPRDAIQNGICLIPEERRNHGLFLDEKTSTNLTIHYLKKISHAFFLNHRKEAELSGELIQKLHISPQKPNINVKYLSGGNQQKVVIGKWLKTNNNIYIFDEPTKGIDVNAKQEIFQLIQTLAKQGKSILYFSSEWEELLSLADRIIILKEGKIVKSLLNNLATYEKLVYYASTGGAKVGTSTCNEIKEKSKRLDRTLSL